MIQNLDNNRAVAIATLKDWGIVYVIVDNAAVVRLGDNPEQLTSFPTDGIPMTNAIPAQQSYVWWKGKLWAIANIACRPSIQVPGIIPQGR